MNSLVPFFLVTFRTCQVFRFSSSFRFRNLHIVIFMIFHERLWSSVFIAVFSHISRRLHPRMPSGSVFSLLSLSTSCLPQHFSQFSNIEEIYRTSAFEILISFFSFFPFSFFLGCISNTSRPLEEEEDIFSFCLVDILRGRLLSKKENIQ